MPILPGRKKIFPEEEEANTQRPGFLARQDICSYEERKGSAVIQGFLRPI
jgi:hypothetical protein